MKEIVYYNSLPLSYKEGSCRYDKNLYKVLKYLRKHHKLHPILKKHKPKKEHQNNICYYNTVRDNLNSIYVKKSNGKWVYKLGMKIIVEKNCRRLKNTGIMKGEIYTIDKIEGNKIYIDKEKYVYYVLKHHYSEVKY